MMGPKAIVRKMGEMGQLELCYGRTTGGAAGEAFGARSPRHILATLHTRRYCADGRKLSTDCGGGRIPGLSRSLASSEDGRTCERP